MTGRPQPVMVVGSGPRVAAELTDLLDRSVVAVCPGSAAQLATEIRRWQPAVVILVDSAGISAEQAAELREAMRVGVIEMTGDPASCTAEVIAAAVQR